jgi:hypothetical protein
VGLFSGLLSIRIEGALSGGDLRLATRLVMGEISKLRGKAAYTRKDQEMGFNMDENSFYPIEPLPDDGGDLPWSSEERSRALNVKRFPDGVSLEDVVILSRGKTQEGEARIRFYANGCIDQSLIHLRNQKDETYTLDINPLTGRVIVYDRYVDQKTVE